MGASPSAPVPNPAAAEASLATELIEVRQNLKREKVRAWREREASQRLLLQVAAGAALGGMVLGAGILEFLARRRILAATRFLRVQHHADLAEVRRRATADVENAKKFGVEAFGRDVLGIADNLERAQSCLGNAKVAAAVGPGSPAVAPGPAPGSEDVQPVQALAEGLVLTEQCLLAALSKNGIEKQEPLNQEFDPNLHEAMMRVEGADPPPGRVADVLRSGYMLQGRVLRAAQVAVSLAPSSTAEGVEAPEGEDASRAGVGGAQDLTPRAKSTS